MLSGASSGGMNDGDNTIVILLFFIPQSHIQRACISHPRV